MAEKSSPKAETPTATNVESKPKKGNKMLFIIIAVIVAACVICSGIGFVVTVVLDKAGDEIEDELDDINEDSIEDSIEDSLEDSFEGDSDADVDFDFDGGADLPEGFPSEIKMYDDTKISSSTRVKDDNGNYEYTVIATADASAEDVIDFFKDSLDGKGWEVTSESNIFGSSLTMEKNGMTLTVVAFGDFTGGDGSTYTLTLVEE